MKKTSILVSITLSVILIITLSVIGNMKPEVTLAQHGMEGEGIKDQLKLMQSIYLINSLNLSSDQITALLPVIEEAEGIREEIKTEKEKTEAEIVQELNKINQNLAKNIEPSEEEVARLKEMKEEMKAIPESVMERAEEIQTKMDDLFTEEQKEIINNYDPRKVMKGLLKIEDEEGPGPEGPGPEGPGEGKPPKNGNMDGRIEKIEAMLVKGRELSDEEYARKKDHILAKFSERLTKANFSWTEIQKKVDEVSKILDETRNMSDEEFEAQKTEIAKKIVSSVKGDKKFEKIVRELVLNPDLLPVLKAKI